MGPGGLVEFRYKPDGKTYRTHQDKFVPVAGAAPAKAPPPPATAAKTQGAAAVAPRASAGGAGRTGRTARGIRLVGMADRRPEAVSVQLWTDGACSGNPGPAGAGVHYSFGGEVREVSEYLGSGTNNIAELTAILRGLELVDDKAAPVDLMSDSEYAMKVVAGAYKAKKNVELITVIQGVLAGFSDLQLVKVPGHAGVPGNERADELARLAITRRASSRT